MQYVQLVWIRYPPPTSSLTNTYVLWGGMWVYDHILLVCSLLLCWCVEMSIDCWCKITSPHGQIIYQRQTAAAYRTTGCTWWDHHRSTGRRSPVWASSTQLLLKPSFCIAFSCITALHLFMLLCPSCFKKEQKTLLTRVFVTVKHWMWHFDSRGFRVRQRNDCNQSFMLLCNFYKIHQFNLTSVLISSHLSYTYLKKEKENEV